MKGRRRSRRLRRRRTGEEGPERVLRVQQAQSRLAPLKCDESARLAVCPYRRKALRKLPNEVNGGEELAVALLSVAEDSATSRIQNGEAFSYQHE